jgi:hypothetical protein
LRQGPVSAEKPERRRRRYFGQLRDLLVGSLRGGSRIYFLEKRVNRILRILINDM